MLISGRDHPSAEPNQATGTVGRSSCRTRRSLPFMFETRFRQRVTRYAADLPRRQKHYADCWRGLRRHFDPARTGNE
ncbi:MAG: homogentisate 1,2-dioxygenase domain-containing protein [Xanthobacteraceae bacterium]